MVPYPELPIGFPTERLELVSLGCTTYGLNPFHRIDISSNRHFVEYNNWSEKNDLVQHFVDKKKKIAQNGEMPILRKTWYGGKKASALMPHAPCL